MQAPVVIKSLNLFVDTDQTAIVGHPQNKGDDVTLHFEGNSIEAGDGEHIKVSLLQFNMYNNLFTTDANNAHFKMYTTPGGNKALISANIPYANYRNCAEISTAFSTVVADALLEKSKQLSGLTDTTYVVSGAKPTGFMVSTGPRILDMTIEMKNGSNQPTPHGFTNLVIQCNRGDGESYQLLGALGLDALSDDETSFIIDVSSDPTKIRVTGHFPMQRVTEPFVYIRCGQNQNSLESSILSHDAKTHRRDIHQSNILGRAVRDTEFVHYEVGAVESFTISLQQRRLSTLRLFLTDSKGRQLGRTQTQGTGTAAGNAIDISGPYTSSLQSTKGNLSFSAVLKIETVRVTLPNQMHTTAISPPLPARQAQSILTWPDYGNPR
tara:strand:+ start:1135 stop:2277 length:1143 start_codon:yes stop_codon:yes gene_type:complete